ncbi:hypothetical protein chiPu_0021848, partial [Chiloscyllium punctatum]|nr:hypothetical protein [Chiloscyllium punctatum]
VVMMAAAGMDVVKPMVLVMLLLTVMVEAVLKLVFVSAAADLAAIAVAFV